jgi:hypothetical protein
LDIIQQDIEINRKEGKMRKYWLILLMAVVVLSACTPAATVAPTQENTATVLPPTATAVTTVANTPTGPACKPFNLLDEVIPAADPRVPAVNTADWTTGPATALVTIIDYSDFQ